MNAYEHKQTREVRLQEFSPGDDWELIATPSWVDYAWGAVGLILFIAAMVLMEGK